MKCVVCRQGQTRPGKTTVVLQRGGATVVISDVPARVCEHCGEEYVDESVAEKVLAAAEASARAGVRVEIRDYVTRPAEARVIEPDLPPRDPPIRWRAKIPTARLELVLHEGRNRQVRRMTAAVGLPTLRLVRVRIGAHALAGLAPGESRVIMSGGARGSSSRR